MQQMQRAFNYLIAEPFVQVLWCLFQPLRFKQACGFQTISQRVPSMLRLALPIWLLSFLFLAYPLVLLRVVTPLEIALPPLLLVTLWSTALASLVGVVWGMLVDMQIGIVGGIILGVGLSFAWRFGLEIGAICEISLFLGIVLSKVGGFMGDIPRSALGWMAGSASRLLLMGVLAAVVTLISSFAMYLVSIILNAVSTNLFLNNPFLPWTIIIIGAIAGIPPAIFLAAPLRFSKVAALDKLRRYALRIGAGVLTGIVLMVLANIIPGTHTLLSNAALSITDWLNATSVSNSASPGVSAPQKILVAVGWVVLIAPPTSLALSVYFIKPFRYTRPIHKGIEEGIAWGILWTVLMEIFAWYAAPNLAGMFEHVLSETTIDPFSLLAALLEAVMYPLLGAALYALGYALNVMRLPPYINDCLSLWSAYNASRAEPARVFERLHHSAIYWDDRVTLPLPLLQNMLDIALEEDSEQMQEEVAFIVADRPHQAWRIQQWLLTVIMTNVGTHETLSSIAADSPGLEQFLPRATRMFPALWVGRLSNLHDAMREAVNYRNADKPQFQRDALNNMLACLNKVQLRRVAFVDGPAPVDRTGFAQQPSETLTPLKRLNMLISRWHNIAREELAVLEQEIAEIEEIEDPYIPGRVLEPGNSRFVGRRRLVEQLQQSLDLGQHHPTFSLSGERRVGKSSMLQQLPRLLSTPYLPVYFDLQNRGISSSAATFLNTIAGEIYNVLHAKAIRVDQLEKTRLEAATQQNEAAVYYVFDEWLKNVEAVLRLGRRTVLLCFDEFEKLEEATSAGYLDLHLLLDWFRNIIQNHPCVALLFSGAKSVGEVGPRWSGYFVNVQTILVGFLEPEEAYQLITTPVRYFPGEQIFGKEVIGEILRVTGCHPFLVQAVCSALITELKIRQRAHAELQDVRNAVEHVMEAWDSYFRDLWERSSPIQRDCLSALYKLRPAGVRELMQALQVSEGTVVSTLQTLKRRDLVVSDYGTYRIATPIFREMVKRNN